jgi:hypothetical protein
MDPAALAVLEYIGRPRTPGNADGTSNFQRPEMKEETDYSSNTIRIDHNFTPRQRTYGRVSWYDRNSNYNNYFDNISTGQRFRFVSRQAVFDHVWTMGASTVWNVRYGYDRFLRGDQGNPGNFGMDLTSLGFPSYRRFTAWVPQFGVELAFIGSGPYGGDLGWTRRFFTKLLEKGERQLNRLWGWGLHHYSWNTSRGATTDWYEGKGDAVQFSSDEWYELLNEADRLDGLIAGHWAVMGELDRRHRVKLVVDEWGAWYRDGSEVHASHLFGQQSTMRDALLAALTLDTFHRHADRVAMANVAQLVNCLHSLFLAHEDRFVATPTFAVFEMYGAHVGGDAVRTVCSAPRISYQSRW